MKPRERVEMTLHHEVPDRCPMQISFTPEFADRLQADLALNQEKAHNPHGGGNTYVLERSLGEDMLLTSVGWANSYYLADSDYLDEWGIGWKVQPYETPFGRGFYTEIDVHPLADDDAISNYQPPDPHRESLYQESQRMITEFQSDYWIVGVAVTTILETAWALRGLEQLLMDMVVDPDLTNELLDIPYNYHRIVAKKLARLGVDMIWLGDDVGSQNQMLISPTTWRKYFKQRMATIISEVKGINPGLKVAYHSDGNIEPIIPDLIEIGLDVLNPIQPASMNPAQLKKRFGKNLCYWGTIDEQKTLPFSTPHQVREEVINRIEEVGFDGGLILSPTHHVQLDTPMENFWAMVDTILGTPYRSRKTSSKGTTG